MKAMSKHELAESAGISVKTLMNWCKPHMQELSRMGLRPHAKKLEPHIVAYIVEKFCIDL